MIIQASTGLNRRRIQFYMSDINQFHYPAEQWAQLDEHSKLFWCSVVLPQHNTRQLNAVLSRVFDSVLVAFRAKPIDAEEIKRYTLEGIQSLGGGIDGERNKTSILTTMIGTECIPLSMIQYYIDTYTPNVQRSALFSAIQSGRNDVLHILVNIPGVDINKPSGVMKASEFRPLQEDLTPLMMAISRNNIDAVNILLDCKGIDVNYKNIYGETALVMAYNTAWVAYECILNLVHTTPPPVAQFLGTAFLHDTVIARGQNISDRAMSPNMTKQCFGNMCSTLHTEYLRGDMTKYELREKLANIFFQRLYTYPGTHRSLSYVVKYSGHADYHQYQSDVPIGYFSYDAHTYPYQGGQELYNAVVANNEEEVERLLETEGMDVNFLATDAETNNNKTALIAAILNDRLPIVRTLLQHPHIDVNNGFWKTQHTDWNIQCHARIPFLPPFHLACRLGPLELVNYFLEHPNTDVNQIYILSHTTGLMEALRNEHMDIVQRLLDVPNLDVNHVSNPFQNGILETAGHAAYHAIVSGHEDIARMILSHSGAARHLYRSVLKKAAELGFLRTVELCLELGTRDTYAAFRRCKSAAFLKAVECGNIEIAELLYDAKRFRTHYYKDALRLVFCEVVNSGSIDTLRFLIMKTNIDINGILHKNKVLCWEPSPLSSAILKNDTDKVSFLLEQPTMRDTLAIVKVAIGINEHTLKLSIFQSVAGQFNLLPRPEEIVDHTFLCSITIHLDMLIAKRLYTNDTLCTAFCTFIQGNDPYIVNYLKLLTQAPGFDVNRNNAEGCSAFDVAIKSRNLDALRYLLSLPTLDRVAVDDIYTQNHSLIALLPDVEQIIRDDVYFRRECRALTEINLFGGFRDLPADILRNIRDCLKGMPPPDPYAHLEAVSVDFEAFSDEGDRGPMFVEDFEALSEGEDMRATYAEDEGVDLEALSEGEDMRATYAEDEGVDLEAS